MSSETPGHAVVQVKRARSAGEVLVVSVHSRHRPDSDRSGKASLLGDDCPKQLLWYRNGKLIRQAALTCDGDKATEKAEKLQASFEAAASGAPQPVAERGSHPLEDAIDLHVESMGKIKPITDGHRRRVRSE